MLSLSSLKAIDFIWLRLNLRLLLFLQSFHQSRWLEDQFFGVEALSDVQSKTQSKSLWENSIQFNNSHEYRSRAANWWPHRQKSQRPYVTVPYIEVRSCEASLF